jgi:hypothetical protein
LTGSFIAIVDERATEGNVIREDLGFTPKFPRLAGAVAAGA